MPKMTSELNLIEMKKYLRQVIIEKTTLVPHETTEVKIGKLTQVSHTSYKVYCFSLHYNYNNNSVNVELLLKLFEPIDFCRERCRKEYQILKYLKNALFPVPEAYVLETTESYLKGPFIIMEKIKGENIADYIKRQPKREITTLIKRFSETLAMLHELNIDDLVSDVLVIPKNEYSCAKKCTLAIDELKFAKNWDYHWITGWLKIHSKKSPCSQYSLLHHDVQPKHYIVDKKGKIFFIDWELAQLGDALRDVSFAFHDLRNMVGAKVAFSFLKHYIAVSKKEIDHSKLRFYIVCTGLRQTLHIRYLTTRPGLLYLIKLFGAKQIAILPITYLRYILQRKRTEIFLRNEIINHNKLFEIFDGL